MVNHILRDVVGAFGGFILALCMLPQLFKMWRTHSADDLSLSFVFTYTVGETLITPGP